MKILVINPYVTDFKLYDEWMHPLGLYFLMDILRKNGHSISYFNCLQSYSSSPRKHGTASFNFTGSLNQLYTVILNASTSFTGNQSGSFGIFWKELQDQILSALAA